MKTEDRTMRQWGTSAACGLVLCTMALPSWADEKEWFCEVRSAVRATLEGTEDVNFKKFKMNVSENEVQFGPSGLFHGQRLEMDEFVRPSRFEASDPRTKLSFREGSFQFARVIAASVLGVSAQCRDSAAQ